MNLFIIILLITYMNLFVFSDKSGDVRYKSKLRGMYKEELERLVQESLVNTFESIYDKILEYAKEGKNEYDFTIMCEGLPNSNCEILNGHQYWLQHYPNNVITKAKSYITIEKYTTNSIDALHRTFPDSNITKIYKNCCDYHIIKW